MYSDEKVMKLAEELGATKMRLAQLTDACNLLLAAAEVRDGAPSGGQWKDFHQDVMSWGSKVTVQDLHDDMTRMISRV